MLHRTLSGANAAGSGFQRACAAPGRMVVGALFGLCAVLMVGIAVRAASLLGLIPSLLQEGLSEEGARFLLVSVVKIALELAALAAFTSFVLTVAHRAEFFSRSQTARLLAVGAIYAAHTLTGLFMPAFTPPAGLASWVHVPTVEPELDLNSLILSMMFFALAGVFEYGRILQEDSDNIL